VPKSTNSKRANASRVAEAARSDQGTDPQILAQTDAVLKTPVRRDPVADREAFLRALQAKDDAQIEATWPGAVVTKTMLADKVISHHGEGDYSITGRGLAELMGPYEIVPDADGLEPEQTGQYGEDDVVGSELTEDATQEQLDAEYDTTVVEIRAEIGTTCACGCGAGITPKRVFRQGHDQRLIGLLAEAARDGKEIGHLSGGVLITGSPRTYGAKVLADGGQYKLDNAIKLALIHLQKRTERLLAKKARATAAARREIAALEQELADVPTTQTSDVPLAKVPHEPAHKPGDEIGVRIGRHIYNARIHGMNQAGKVTAVEYTVKSSGAKKIALGGKFEITSD